MREPKFESTDKYVTKFEYELAGKTFDLIMDNGYEYVANFLSGDIVMWAEKGEPFRWEKYSCLKSDDTTYFVVMQLFGQPLRTCRTLILDLENSLVTMHVAKQGGIPNRPRMVQVEIIFGAISRPGQTLPLKRHSYTADLVGKKINWTYSSGFVNTHIYISEMYYRSRAIKRPPLPADITPEQSAKIKAGEERAKEFLYEEPIRCVKIKDNCYLCSGIEENMNRLDNSSGGNNLLILSNMKEGFDVGRTFCLDNDQQPESGLFRSFGAFTDEDIEVAHLPSPYRV
jgi:hypothetical protein